MWTRPDQTRPVDRVNSRATLLWHYSVVLVNQWPLQWLSHFGHVNFFLTDWQINWQAHAVRFRPKFYLDRFIVLPLGLNPKFDHIFKFNILRWRVHLAAQRQNCQLSLKISCKSVRKFLHKVANRQTDRQTNKQTDKQTKPKTLPP